MATYWQFHVRLLDVQADLWRRFLLATDANFGELHCAIQDACGWGDCHLFAFWEPDLRTIVAGVPNPDMPSAVPEAFATPLSGYFDADEPRSCVYQYDFGDDWCHEVVLESVEKRRVAFFRRLLDGKGAFPPEDCGSTPGYERCVAAATGKGWRPEYGDEEQRRELVEWLEGWTPRAFSLPAAKREFLI